MVFQLSPGATTGIAIVLFLGFIVWKFILQPIENEGKPIEPPEEPEESPMGF